MWHILDTNPKKEYAVLVLCTILLLITIIPSLIHARREHQDGLVREHVAELKRTLEAMNNKLGYYPTTLPSPIAPYEYHVTKADGEKAIEWYVRGTTENPHTSSTGYDAEEGHNFWYRYIHANNTTYYDICGGGPSCDIGL